jgi:CBS domain-containing protein
MTLLVRHVMAETPKSLSPQMVADDAAGLMASFDIGAVPVTDEAGRIMGIVTDRDIVLRVLAARRDPSVVPLDTITTKEPITVGPDAEVVEASRLMAEHQVRRLPVTKGDRLVGMVSMGDIAVGLSSKRLVGEALEDVSRSEATEMQNEGPDPGTPSNVMEARTVGEPNP